MGKFTSKFFEIPISLYDKALADSVGYNAKSKDYNAIMKIDVNEISHYRDAVDEEKEELSQCIIYFKSGDTTVIDWSLDEFESRLNKFNEKSSSS